jgi:hypothetical protein
MARGRTLWEMLVDKLQGPIELKCYNPLRARVGSPVTIDTLDWRDHDFFLREIRQYKRSLGSKEFFFVDYALLARPLGGEDEWVRLRLNPVADPTKVSGLTHDVLLLRLDDEMSYNEDLHRVVRDDTKKFQVLQDGKVVEEYWRIHDVSSPYRANVTVVKDSNADNKAGKDEVETLQLDYWDYRRETKDEAGQPQAEFLFVEMTADDGWFQIWKGAEIDPQRVMVL